MTVRIGFDHYTISHRGLSPDATLDFAQEHGFRLLDAGISTVAGEPNLGLIHFKRGLGFSESLKLRMTKTLA